MNTIARLPAHAALPVLPLPLERQVQALAEPSRYGDFAVQRPSPRPDPDAARYLSDFEYVCHQPEPGTVIAWLAQLALAVGNAPSDADFRARATTVVGTLADLPAAVWTSQTLAEASRTLRFWPSVAELDGLLRPRAEAIWRRRDALRRIAEARHDAAPPPRADPTDAERAHVSATSSALVVELRAEGAEHNPRPASQARYLSDGQLLAIYEHDAREHPDEGMRRLAINRAATLQARLAGATT